jgi:hypothetical protein
MAVQKQDGHDTDVAESSVDLTGKEYLLCKKLANGKLAICGEGEPVAGVISEGRPVGKHTSFNTGGILKVKAGGPVQAGAKVQCNAVGKADDGSTNSFGVARNTVTREDEMLEVTVDRT